MRRERRILLVILSVSLLLSVFGSLLYAGMDRLRKIQDQIELLKKQYLIRLSKASSGQMDLGGKMRELRKAEDAEVRRYYEKDEMDLYRFGSAVNALLARHAITVEEFRTVAEAGGPVVELTASGSSPSFMAFLADVSNAQKYWTIPYLHIQSSSGDGSLTCEFQIGYIVNENEKQVP